MRFEIVTLFPELFDVLRSGLLGKARDTGAIDVLAITPREFATDRHRSVDDSPYGGGSGMVLMPGPIAAALDHLDEARGGQPTHRVLLTPQGVRFSQAHARRFSELACLTLVCGRYEGFDERIRGLVDEEVSLGDFVLLGGETAALAVIEASARLLPGVLGNEQSAADESHADGLLEYPQYTRPEEFRGQKVPEVLRSGNHAAIARWRRKESLRRTLERRPDLLKTADLAADDRAILEELDGTRAPMSPVYCALVHHPVLDRQGDEVTTSVTNLDVHDIARSARTYGLRGDFVVSPIEAQHPVVQRIVDHWCSGAGKLRFPERGEAIALVEICRSIDDAIAEITARHGHSPRLVATSAKSGPGRCSCAEEAARLRNATGPTLLLFGTGHGLSDRLLQRADVVLEPIQGPSEFNHLSVRAAVAITLDRLFGKEMPSQNPI